MTYNTFYVKDAFINTTIYDDSAVSVTDAILPKRLTILQPIFASKGKSNIILDFDSASLVSSTYGDDMADLKKFGQGGMNLLHAMSGGASAQVCRLLPDNATTAALLAKLVVSVAKTGETISYLDNAGTTQTKVLTADSLVSKIKFVEADASSVTDGKFKKEVTIKTPAVKHTVIEADVADSTVIIEGKTFNVVESKVVVGENSYGVGEEFTVTEAETSISYTVPLFKLVYNGAGKCGNSMGVSIENDYERDDSVTDGRRYKMTLYEVDDNGNTSKYGDSFYFALNPDALLVEGSEVYENLQYVFTNKDSSGTERAVFCKPYIMDTFASLNELIASCCDTSEDSVNVDIINCTDKNGDRYADELDDKGEIASVARFFLDPETEGIGDDMIYYLKGGSDGDLELGHKKSDGTTVTEEDIENTKNSLLCNFFKGQVDPAVFDERMVTSDIVFDADYSYADVKPVMLGKFRAIRPDIMVIADIGTEASNCTQAMNLIKGLYGKVDGSAAYTAAVIAHAGYTTDRALNQHVTGTYDYAYGLAKCYGLLGTFSVFAGYQNAKVQTMEFDWLPYKDEFDTMIGPLKKLGCIFAFKIDRAGTVAYMSEDNMYTQTTSRLKSIRNGMVIGDAVRLCKSVLIKYVYDNDGAAGSIRKAGAELAERVSGRYPSNITVAPNLYQSDRDKLLETTTCDLTYYFPGMSKGWTLNIYAKRGE